MPSAFRTQGTPASKAASRPLGQSPAASPHPATAGGGVAPSPTPRSRKPLRVLGQAPQAVGSPTHGNGNGSGSVQWVLPKCQAFALISSLRWHRDSLRKVPVLQKTEIYGGHTTCPRSGSHKRQSRPEHHPPLRATPTNVSTQSPPSQLEGMAAALGLVRLHLPPSAHDLQASPGPAASVPLQPKLLKGWAGCKFKVTQPCPESLCHLSGRRGWGNQV